MRTTCVELNGLGGAGDLYGMLLAWSIVALATDH